MEEELKVLWTEKNNLDRIMDPLSLSGLKFIEDDFLVGITTQVQRLRYFSFLTWAWHTIKEDNLPFKTILSMEKVFTLISAYHHLGRRDYPIGIRNRQDAENFIVNNSLIDVEKFTSFGRNNRVGYGQYYYHGPLNTLLVFWGDEERVIFSEFGEKIAKVYGRELDTDKDLFIKGKFKKEELKRFADHCACQVRDAKEEVDLWRKVIFGFTKSPILKQDLVFDEKKYKSFISGNYKFPEAIEDDNTKRMIMIFTVMKIIDEVNPTKRTLEQSLRDGFYFGEYVKDKKVIRIDYGNLAKIKKYLEVYVHNLYYTDILEYIFTYILEVIQKKTLGSTLDEILETIDIKNIEKEILEIFKNRGIKLENCKPQNIIKVVDSLEISLKDGINERQVFLDFMNSNDIHVDLSRLIVLLFLLRKRYYKFDDEQKEKTELIDDINARPGNIYAKIMKISISDLFRLLFTTVVNLHRYTFARKYMIDSTRSWLFTVEEDKLYYYGQFYDFRPYRESKWPNTVDLLYDLDLVNFDENYSLTEDGKSWLKKVV